MTTPRRFTTKDARDLNDAAYKLRSRADRLERLSQQTDDALDRLAREVATLGWAERGDDAQVQTSRGDSLTERHTAKSSHLQALRDHIRSEIRGVVDHANDSHAADGLEFALAAVWKGDPITTKPEPVCCDNQVGKHAAAEWGDGTCSKPAVKSGLCTAHYFAWWRARRRDGIDTARDFEPAA